MKYLFVVLAALTGLMDWPQWGGPARDFTAQSKMGNVDRQDPLELLWERPVAEGNSGLVVASRILVSQSRRDDNEFVFALDAQTGEELWRDEYPARPEKFMLPRYGPGPHSTPCISQGIVCTVGGTGILNAYRLANGEKLWTLNLWEQFSPEKQERGYAASPLVVDDKVIVPVGGNESGVVAFELKSGKLVWRSTSFESAYASPMILTIDGKEQLICLMDQELIALEPNSGKLLWKFDYPTTKTVHVASPLILPGNRIFFLSTNRATLLEIQRDQDQTMKPNVLWQSRQLTPQVGNIVSIDGQLIGPSSNSSVALLTSLDQQSGKRLWKTRTMKIGFLYQFEDGFVALDEQGELSFNRLQNGRPETLAKYPKTFTGRVWNTAAVSRDRIYVRDKERIHAFRIRRTDR